MTRFAGAVVLAAVLVAVVRAGVFELTPENFDSFVGGPKVFHTHTTATGFRLFFFFKKTHC
jgi:hypothetical protein